jgi:phosphosulfolactate synthase (CoM biosynthesis protein A)
MNDFDFLHLQKRADKPRKKSLTEVRASYYTVVGLNYLEDLLGVAAPYIDSIKFAGGAFTLYPDKMLRQFIDTCHRHGVEVSTGGFVEHVLTQGRSQVEKYINTCRKYEFDILELSAGFISIATDDWLRLCELVREKGMKPKPEVGILFGAGGDTPESEEKDQLKNADQAVQLARRFVDAGAWMIMIESEGITENVSKPRSEVPARFIHEIGMEKLMFEAADPEVFTWYIKNFGPDVNVFVDHSQILQLECLRRGMWGMNDVWGRIVRF